MSGYQDVAAKDRDEIKVLTTTLTSMVRYKATAIANLVEPRRVKYKYLDQKYKDLVDSYFLKHLDAVEDGIKDNAFFFEQVVRAAALNFGAPADRTSWSDCLAEDVQKSVSTLRQVAREWGYEGFAERQICFGRIVRELETLYPDRKARHEVRVLCPGSGLGRLPFDLAAMGFRAEGNEFSYHMLFTSSLILNHTDEAMQFRIRPYLNTFSHHRSRQSQLHQVLVPDVSPKILTQHMANDPDIPEEGLMSMTAGSFDQTYPPQDGKLFDVIATTFFLDTAANIFNTLDTIHKTLKQGGKWINFGPLLWHYEEIAAEPGQHSQDAQSDNEDRSCGLEFTLEDLLKLVEDFGFKFEKRESNIPSIYTSPQFTMGGFQYLCEYWVATKL